MKPINEMTLAECIERLRELPYGTVDDVCDTIMLPHLPWISDVATELADRIDELTRWIPVSERLPTKENADKLGRVLLCWKDGHVFTHITMPFHKDYHSHWRRVDEPEGI